MEVFENIDGVVTNLYKIISKLKSLPQGEGDLVGVE